MQGVQIVKENSSGQISDKIFETLLNLTSKQTKGFSTYNKSSLCRHSHV